MLRKASRSVFGTGFTQTSGNLCPSTSLSRCLPTSPCWLEASHVVLAILPLVFILFPATLLLQCTHIEGRNDHNPFAVALSTNAMFIDVLHSLVTDPTHYTVLWWALRWIREIQTQRFHWLVGLTIMLRLFHLMKPWTGCNAMPNIDLNDLNTGKLSK